MGRKKSKTSKQKHAKAASLTSSSRKHKKSTCKAFGVPLANTTTTTTTNPLHKRIHTTKSKTNSNKASPFRNKVQPTSKPAPLTPSSSSSTSKPSPPTIDTEQQEFHAEYASLRERHRFQQPQQSKHRTKKHTPDTKVKLTFTAPTLRLGNEERRKGDIGRSTEDLIGETVGRFSHTSVHGSSMIHAPLHRGTKVVGGDDGDDGVEMVGRGTEVPPTDRNRFAVLMESEDEDGEDGWGEGSVGVGGGGGGVGSKVNPMGGFRFAPASFAASTSLEAVGVVDDDPDL